MKCKIDITAEHDMSVWIKTETFMCMVDQEDLKCRDQKVVLDAYLSGWFYHRANGDLGFTPPAFRLKHGRFFGISGRHRAILLCRHLEIIPMLLTHADECDQAQLDDIIVRKIEVDEEISLPDLPRRETLP